jgi:hypothetical protein
MRTRTAPKQPEAKVLYQGRVSIRQAFLLALLAALLMAVPASAQQVSPQSPTVQTYGGDQGEVAGTFAGGGSTSTPPSGGAPSGTGAGQGVAGVVRSERGAGTAGASAGSSLPFTGFEAGLVALIGLALLGAGFGVRRATRHPGAPV